MVSRGMERKGFDEDTGGTKISGETGSKVFNHERERKEEER